MLSQSLYLDYLLKFLQVLMPIVISAATFTLTWFAFRRETPKLSLEIRPMTLFTHNEGIKILAIMIINTGRRVVIPTSLAGERKALFSERLKKIFLRKKPMLIENFLDDSIQPQIVPNGVFQQLTEGQQIQIAIPWETRGKLLARKIAALKSVYVHDSTRAKHYLSKQSIRELKNI